MANGSSFSSILLTGFYLPTELPLLLFPTLLLIDAIIVLFFCEGLLKAGTF